MNLRQLEYVHYIVRYKTIREASKKLYVTEPTISQQINVLEKEIGFKLFKRQGRNIVLSSEGEKLYPSILEIIENVENLQRNIMDIKEPTSGTLQLGLGPVYMDDTLSYLVETFYKLYPKVNLNIFESGSMALLELLLSGDIDIAIINSSDTTKKYMEKNQVNFIELSQVEFVLMVSNDHSLAKKKEIYLKDLYNEPMMLYRKGLIRELVIDIMGEGFKKNIIYSFEDYNSMVNLVKEKVGVSIVPKHYADTISTNQKNGVSFLKILDFNNNITKCCVYKRKKYYTNYFKAFIEIINSENA